MAYQIPLGFVPIVASHGNAKEKKPYFATWPSTMDKLKGKCLQQGPKSTIEHVSSSFGGVTGALAPGQLPRNEMQITKLKRRVKLCNDQHISGSDELLVVMQQAYSQDPASKFIRSMRTTPDPAIVVSEQCQIKDMERFCTCSTGFGILTVDPTFSLGDFDVTPVTYRHLLLETRRNGNTPVFLGPVLIHYRKTFDTYLYFASSLVGISRKLEGIMAFGTDGEESLSDAFGHEFRFSQKLTCFIHVRRNLKDKLNQFNIPVDVSKMILDDIFGKKMDSSLVEGIVDACNFEDFQSKVDAITESWRACSMPSTAKIEDFIDYFMKHKASVIRDTMLRPVREECGLGSPPAVFTTNASESINAMLKHKTDYKRSELPEFLDKIKELQWNPSITATIGEQHDGRYTGVAVVEGFCV